MKTVILGTAQWGLDYGATNALGRLSVEALNSLATQALTCGIRMLDTAPAYGDAESRIGSLGLGFEVQTKVSVASGGPVAARESLKRSRDHLRMDSVSGLLVHDWNLVPDETRSLVAGALEILRGEGLCSRIGVSAYAADEIDGALEAFDQLDVVQIPVNLLDQRLCGSPAIERARARGTVVQARSVFLQGAALAPAEHSMFGAHPDVVRLRGAGDPVALCLGYVAAQSWVDELVVGVTSVAELDMILDCLDHPLVQEDWSQFASSDGWLIDPRKWTAPTLGE